jgi:hypothetical protein
MPTRTGIESRGRLFQSLGPVKTIVSDGLLFKLHTEVGYPDDSPEANLMRQNAISLLNEIVLNSETNHDFQFYRIKKVPPGRFGRSQAYVQLFIH